MKRDSMLLAIKSIEILSLSLYLLGCQKMRLPSTNENGKQFPYTLLIGMQSHTASLENRLRVLINIHILKNPLISLLDIFTLEKWKHVYTKTWARSFIGRLLKIT